MNGGKKEERVCFDSDNLIYNRFDLIYPGCFNEHIYDWDNARYVIRSFIEDGVARLDIWGKEVPQGVFDHAIEDVFLDRAVYAVEVTRGKNQYHSFLEKTNDIRVPLPETEEELMNRVARRDRATIRRKLRWLDERIGSLEILTFAREAIPYDLVETYFSWKKATHGTDYHLLPQEYLNRYHVTDAMQMCAGDTEVAVAFFCQIGDIVFFENFSYNSVLLEYSPGLLMYVKFMEELIHRRCCYLYLGGGGYIYKHRFGAEESIAYSGMIYRPEIVERLNTFFEEQAISTVAFYGFGVCGHSFLQLSKNLALTVGYGIDCHASEEMAEEEIPIYAPEGQLPKADAVFITLNEKDTEVDVFLYGRFPKVYYWNDILQEAIKGYRLKEHYAVT